MNKMYKIWLSLKSSEKKYEAYGMNTSFNRKFVNKEIQMSKINSNNDLIKFLIYGTPYSYNEVAENQFYSLVKKFSTNKKEGFNFEVVIYDKAVEFLFSFIDTISNKKVVCEKEQYAYDEELGALNDCSYKTVEDKISVIKATCKYEKEEELAQAITNGFNLLNKKFINYMKKSINNKKKEINKELEKIDNFERML